MFGRMLHVSYLLDRGVIIIKHTIRNDSFIYVPRMDKHWKRCYNRNRTKK